MARKAKLLDLVGNKYGRLTVVSRGVPRESIRPSGHKRIRQYWNCLCECGRAVEVRQDNLLHNDSQSCGCLRDDVAKENVKKAQAVKFKKKPEDLTGMDFGRLTALFPAPRSITPQGRELTRWVCRCKCGNEIDVLSASLKSGKTTSCGCVPPDLIDSDFLGWKEVFKSKANIIHGNKYTYENTNYIHSLVKVDVTCKEHGDFSLTPSNHLQGQGCHKCSIEIYAEKQHYNFLERCRLDEKFSNRSGCVYVIKLTNEVETFIKVGVSSNYDKRFNSYTAEGFDLEVVKIAEMTNYQSGVLERELLKRIKSAGYKYNPKTEFVGYTECATVQSKDYILSVIGEFKFE